MLRAFFLSIFLQILIQQVTAENINTHGSQVGLWLCWLLFKLNDTAITGIGVHNTKTWSLVPRNLKYTNSSISVTLLVCCQHLSIIHCVDMVTRKNQYIIWVYSINEIQVLINSICGALIPVCTLLTSIWRQNENTAISLVQIPCITST